jgi:hypothetical protein
MNLADVLLKIHEEGAPPEGKDKAETQRAYLSKTIRIDNDRVYDNDIKKLLNWYGILKTHGFDFSSLVKSEEAAGTESTEDASTETPGEKEGSDKEKAKEGAEKSKAAPRAKKTKPAAEKEPGHKTSRKKPKA